MSTYLGNDCVRKYVTIDEPMNEGYVGLTVPKNLFDFPTMKDVKSYKKKNPLAYAPRKVA